MKHSSIFMAMVLGAGSLARGQTASGNVSVPVANSAPPVTSTPAPAAAGVTPPTTTPSTGEYYSYTYPDYSQGPTPPVAYPGWYAYDYPYYWYAVPYYGPDLFFYGGWDYYHHHHFDHSHDWGRVDRWHDHIGGFGGGGYYHSPGYGRGGYHGGGGGGFAGGRGGFAGGGGRR